VRAVVFDIDGTLIDSAEATGTIAVRFLGDLVAAPLSPDAIRALAAIGAGKY